jgi:hypothetical protein
MMCASRETVAASRSRPSMKSTYIVALLLITHACGTSAQDVGGKAQPSREATVQFINNALNAARQRPVRGPITDVNGNRRSVGTLLNGRLEGCSVRLETVFNYYGRIGDEENHYYDIEFVLSDIESISPPLGSEWAGVPAIKFGGARKAPIVKGMEHPLGKALQGRTTTGEPLKKPEMALLPTVDEQLAKAFEHLRKLCGGPEPLKF